MPRDLATFCLRDEAITLLQAQYLRLNADFENFRRRAATEKDAMGTRTKAKVIEASGRCPPATVARVLMLITDARSTPAHLCHHWGMEKPRSQQYCACFTPPLCIRSASRVFVTLA